MKKYDVLYDFPIEVIASITESQEALIYSELLSENDQDYFITITETIRNLCLALRSAKADKVNYDQWHNLIQQVNEFYFKFPTFRRSEVYKLRTFLQLSASLNLPTESLDEDEIDENLFEIIELSQKIPHAFFCKENEKSFDDSIIIFDNDIDLFAGGLSSTAISPNMIFHFISALYGIDSLPDNQAVLIKKTEPRLDNSSINAFVQLVVLSTGKTIHSPIEYSYAPTLIDQNAFKHGTEYQQWSETIHVLTEYNSRKDLITKFLTIYHVIENFMFKHPIVELEKQMDGRMFSIRDFRRLYKSIDISETEALKRLFKSVFNHQLQINNSNKNIRDHLIERWKRLATTRASKQKVNESLLKIGLEFQFDAFTGDAAAVNYSKLVYEMRNSIVHNKETEFHLTFASLADNPKIADILTQFLIPSLEEICFHLISRPNNQLWYSNRSLYLYQ